ncbi:response regulator transcription factor [Paenibacillus rigui]|uniref:DNA-binding response regulator n=1 Tax=Paenibacillus rigui TaxID=554312 RepID=A0A229UN78_9BACL|nr:response regulator [Paenibacillus rigui]OXM84813.1 DNA-binding response regulator [Paenibacillus rigui]
MVQLLLVDDEVHVVERFSATIDWKAEGIDQVYKAYSAVEALALLEQFSIDIVITDIQMPGMSGLQLIAEIDRRWQKTKCILLSGYSDFNYAKEAIQYQTEDYLLKPVTEKDLVDTVRRVKDKLTKEWEEVLSKQRLTYTLKENLSLLRANLLNDLLQGRKFAESSLRDKMQMLELSDYHGRSFVVMMVRLEEYFLQYDAHSLSLLEYAIGNMVEELYGERYDTWYTKDAHDYLVFVMLGKQEDGDQEGAGWVERTASSLQSAVKTYLKGKISILISSQGQFPGDLTSLYDRSVAVFRRRIGNEHELFMRLDDAPVETAIQSLPSLYEPPTLIHLLEAARWEQIEQKLNAALEQLESRYPESQEHLLEMYFSIASAYTYIAHKNGKQLSDLLGTDYDKLTEGHPFRSVNLLREWSLRTLHGIKADMDQETKDSRTRLINEIRQVIDRKISDDVSLQTIAEHVHLHPVYVSKIYKLETGDNLSDYIHTVRMERAEYLLKNSPNKIYEIAAQLGYQRPHSFNHAFKKHFGMTPQEYRDQFS